MDSKSVAFFLSKGAFNHDGVLFGATLLQGGVKLSWFAKSLMAVYNKKAFSPINRIVIEALTRALKRRFKDVSAEVESCKCSQAECKMT